MIEGWGVFWIIMLCGVLSAGLIYFTARGEE
jgi:hypothetical protein